MARLINADKLRKDILDMPNCYNGYSDAYDKAYIIDVIDEQPTVDAEPVVRCKDCVYAISDPYGMSCTTLCMDTSDDHYCWWGERREDVSNIS